MRLLPAAAAIAACLASGLAACSPSAPTTDGAASAPAAAPAAAPAPSAAMDGPAPGKWRVSMTAMGVAMPPTEICYDKQMSMSEMQKSQQQAGVTCSEQDFHREGDVQVGHTVCTADIGGKTMKITTDMRTTGDFKSKYTTEIVSKMDPPPMAGMEEQKMTMSGERLGDCDPPAK